MISLLISTSGAASSVAEPRQRDWLDLEAMYGLRYPVDFASRGKDIGGGIMDFPGVADDIVLRYWTVGDREEDFLDRVDAQNVVKQENGAVIAIAEELDQETGKKTWNAFLWITDTEKYFDMEGGSEQAPNVAVICETKEKAEYWRGQLLAGAVEIYSLDGFDPNFDLTEAQARETLLIKLEDRLKEGATLESAGEEALNGVKVYKFVYGKGTADEQYYGFSAAGVAFDYDPVADEYTVIPGV
jgi:hypothetical protein